MWPLDSYQRDFNEVAAWYTKVLPKLTHACEIVDQLQQSARKRVDACSTSHNRKSFAFTLHSLARNPSREGGGLPNNAVRGRTELNR